MANFLAQTQFAAPNTAIDLSGIGNALADGIKQQRDRNALMKISAAMRGGDLAGASAAAMEHGNPQVALSLNSLIERKAERSEDRAWRREESERAQKNADRSFGLQEKQLGVQAGQQTWERNFRTAEAGRAQTNADRAFGHQTEVANRAEIRTVKGPNGDDILVRIGRDGTPTEIKVPGQGGEQNNPFMTGGAMNESQSKDALYADRMLQAERIFRDPSVVDAGMSRVERAKSAIPVFGNSAVSDNFQKYDQAKRNFINATLRRESGAVIAESEFANAERQYFPQPGDSPQVLAQKQQNRIDAIKGIGAGGGKGYKPAYTFDAAGNIVDRSAPQGAPRASATPAPPPGFQVVR